MIFPNIHDKYLYRPAEPNVHILLSKKVHIRLCRSVEEFFFRGLRSLLLEFGLRNRQIINHLIDFES